MSDNVKVTSLNVDLLRNQRGRKHLKKISYGKGKVLRTIDKILVTCAAILETIREMPGFEYLKSMTTGNLTTQFNNWIATFTTVKPHDFTGMTAEEIFMLGQKAALTASNEAAKSIGLVFSAVFEFVVQHPTVTVLGVTACFGILAIPFKALINRINKHKLEKLNEQSARVK